MAKETKRREVADETRTLAQWQIDDARRLRALWDARPNRELTQAAFGLEHEIGNQSMVWQLLHARRALNTRFAAAFAQALRCKVADFSPRLAKEIARLSESEPKPSLEQFTLIDRYRDAHHAAGHGIPGDDEGEADQIAFRDDWLRARGWHTKALRAVPASGRSMEPRIQDSDTLLIDTRDTKVANGKIYAIRHDGNRRVKRLFLNADGSLRIRSDNPAPEYAEEVIPHDKLDRIEIIGRVVWIGGSV